MAIDAQWSSVVLLCPFEGADGSTTITDVKEHFIAVAGNAQISTAQYPAGCSSSAKFDGNNDYLTISHADFAIGTGDFDIDFPLYKAGETTTGAANAANIIDFRASDPSVAIQIAVDGGSGSVGANKVYLYVNGSVRITGTTSIGAAFKRVNLSRVSGVTRLFIDGVQEGSSYTDANNYTQTVANIGGRFAAISGDYRSLNGYLGPIRITKHGRGHSTTFTPDSLPFPRPMISGAVRDHLAAPVARPVVAVDRKTSQVLSGTISDAITGAYTIYPRTFGEVTVTRYDEMFDPVTDECLFDLLPIYPRPGPSLVWGVVDTRSHIVSPAGNANFDFSITPFAGLPSISFDGSGDNVNSTSVDYALRTDDLSIEFWYRPINGGHGQASSRIFQIGANLTNGAVDCHCETTNNPSNIIFQFYSSGSWITVVSSSAPLSNNTWHAIQIRRIAGVWTMYADEVLQGTSGSTSYDLTQTALYIGSNTTASESFYGNIGPFRIHKGPRRAAQVTPLANFLKPLLDGGSGENAAIYDRVIPG
ncbi:MAG: hypothetical protein IPJ57_20420 [Gemmatimonadetes bacterium]|nr:hypothetical protein [Gemmatimonadota bacterium]